MNDMTQPPLESCDIVLTDAASRRTRPMAMPAWLAAAVRISKSSGPNASGRLLSTTRTPTMFGTSRGARIPSRRSRWHRSARASRC